MLTWKRFNVIGERACTVWMVAQQRVRPYMHFCHGILCRARGATYFSNKFESLENEYMHSCHTSNLIYNNFTCENCMHGYSGSVNMQPKIFETIDESTEKWHTILLWHTHINQYLCMYCVLHEEFNAAETLWGVNWKCGNSIISINNNKCQ